MNFLIIDTTKKEGIIIADNNGNVENIIMPANEKHSESLLVNIENLLTSVNLRIDDINVFCCVTGPGSFTGIRIGLTTLKGLSYDKDVKIIGENIFNIVSNHVNNGIVLLNSTSTTLYYGEIKNKVLFKYGVVNNDDVKNLITANQKIYVLDNEQLKQKLSYIHYETINKYPSLLYNYFKNKIENNEFTNDEIKPFYIQLSQAERDVVTKEKND